MKVNKITNGDVFTLTVEGRIDSKTAPEFEKEIKECLEPAEKLVIDLAGVNYISSAGLRVLLTGHKAMAAKGGLKVTNVCKEVMAIFNVTGFAGVLDIA